MAQAGVIPPCTPPKCRPTGECNKTSIYTHELAYLKSELGLVVLQMAQLMNIVITHLVALSLLTTSHTLSSPRLSFPNFLTCIIPFILVQ